MKTDLSSGIVLKGSAYTYRIERTLGSGTFGITYLAPYCRAQEPSMAKCMCA